MTKMMPDLEGYFRGLAPDSDALLRELEAEAEQESIPIVGPVVGELLFVLTRATGAKTILELGTATGYSGIFLGRACAQIPGRVISLELDESMAQRAQGNFARAGLTEVVEVRVGEALKLMAEMSETFEPLAKCPGIIREKSLGAANMETRAHYAVNCWQFSCKIIVFSEFWTWLSPSPWHHILSPCVAQLISLSNWSANRAMTPNMR